MIGEIKPFRSIGGEELLAVQLAMDWPLSGYLAGMERGGHHVCELEDAWAKTFHVKHAIACNSATSGLLAAAVAIGLRDGDRFACPAMTMSATCAAPMFTGAKPFFMDVEDETFGLTGEAPHDAPIFVTNLFGHPARLRALREQCDANLTVLVEDNSQSPFAFDHDKYAGTIGHIGVFSLNVHKPLQCGEGGIIVTDDDHLAARMRAFINHGEHTDAEIVGLNLRMPEVCAAIARMQLQRGEEITRGRVHQAEAILAAIPPIAGLRRPIQKPGCHHVWYTIPFLVENFRDDFCAALRAEGVPIVEGYVPPLYRLPAFAKWARHCPVAEDLHDRRLLYFENCQHDVIPEQVAQIGAAFRKAAELTL